MNENNLDSIIHRIKLKTFKLQDIYEILNHRLDINQITIDSELLIIHALYNLPNRPKLFHALLQCGCDMFALNEDGVSAYYLTHIDESNDIPDDTREIFKLYYPGIWAAVDHNNIELVRKSINLWCRTDIERDGLSLMELAENKKNKPVVTLLNSISKSVILAHMVLSDNHAKLLQLLESVIPLVSVQQGGVNVNIQNLGALGATPLYFAMQNNNEAIVQTLIEWGANPAKVLTLENEVEIPIIFLTLRPNISFEIFKIIIRKSSQLTDLSLLRYRSCSLLHCAVDNDVSLEKIEYLLEVSDAKLISVRSCKNVCPVDITKNNTIKELINKKVEFHYNVLEFMMDLISYGYTNFIDILTSSNNIVEIEHIDILTKYLHHVKQFTKHVADCNVIGIQKYLVFIYKDPIAQITRRKYLVNCFGYGDGQPMLHKAVLRGHLKVVQLLCSVIVGTLSRRIDDIVDQFGRTALCYAYLTLPRDISEVLIQFGASEYATDYENRSPLAFRDKFSHSAKDHFLSYHLKQDYRDDEPALWDTIYPNRSYMTYGRNPAESSHGHPDNCLECGRQDHEFDDANSNNNSKRRGIAKMTQRQNDEESRMHGNNGEGDEDEDDEGEEEEDEEDDVDDDEPAGVCLIS